MITAAMAGENDASERELLVLFATQSFEDLGDEASKAIGVFEFSIIGIGGVAGALRNNEDGVASALDKLVDEFIVAQNFPNVIFPAMEVNNQINRAGESEALRNEQSNRVVGIVFLGREKLVLVSVALGA